MTTAVPVGEALETPIGSAAGRRGGIQPSHVLEFTVIALDRRDGKVLWQRVARSARPHAGTHPDGTWASPSPITDGRRVFAFFGSNGLYCFTVDGRPVWEKDLGDMRPRLGFGEGSSPFLYGDRLVVLWDHEDQSFVAAMDAATGKELWRTERDEITTWSTPLVVEHEGRPQVVTGGTQRVRAYDLADGNLLWEAPGLTLNVIPSPVSAGGWVYLTSGFRGAALQAIKLSEARGDVSESGALAWTFDRDTPYVPSPLLYGDGLYVIKSNNGILSRFDARTGRRDWGPVRLEALSGVYASPVGAAGRVYVAGRDGATVVLRHAPEFEVLATNHLDEGFDASPVVVGKELFLRGRHSLYAIAEE